MSRPSVGYLCRSAQRRYIRMSISAKSAASTPPASDRIVTSASRGSYSPARSVRTSSSSIRARRAQLEQHDRVVQPTPEPLHPVQFALDERQARRDPLRLLLVVPEVRRGGRLVELGEVAAEQGQLPERFPTGQ